MLRRLLRSFASRCCCPSLALASLLALTTVGCNTFDPSQWSQEQVAKEIKEQWDLESVELKPAEGGYAGTGKNAEGETFKITVKVDPASKSLSYHGDGDRGDILDYSVRAETVR